MLDFLFCMAVQFSSVNIWYPLLPGDGDDSETPSAKKHPLPVAKGTLTTSTIKIYLNIKSPLYVIIL